MGWFDEQIEYRKKYERELLGTEETGDNGYSAYLPEDVTDDRLVGLVVETNGHFYFAPRSAVK